MKIKPTAFKNLLSKNKKLLIVMHDDPDPDALASAYLLSLIAKKFLLSTRIVYAGGNQ